MAALITIAIGAAHLRLAEISFPFFRHYAKRHGLEFVHVDKPCVDATPTFQKLTLYDILAHHDRVIFADNDVLIRYDAPNLLDVVPKEKLGVFDISKHTTHCDRHNAVIQSELRDIGWGRANFNAGVMVVSRAHRDLFRRDDPDLVEWLGICARSDRRKPPYSDQSYFNFKAQDLKLPQFDIGFRLNHTLASGNSHERFGSYFIHCKGHRKGSKELEMRRAAFVLNNPLMLHLLARNPWLVNYYDRI